MVTSECMEVLTHLRPRQCRPEPQSPMCGPEGLRLQVAWRAGSWAPLECKTGRCAGWAIGGEGAGVGGLQEVKHVLICDLERSRLDT